MAVLSLPLPLLTQRVLLLCRADPRWCCTCIDHGRCVSLLCIWLR